MSTLTQTSAIDLPRLRHDLQATAEALRQQKVILRESGQPRVSWKTWAELRRLRSQATRLRSQATRLCQLRAHCRSRVHLRAMTLELQAEQVSMLTTHYAPVAQLAGAPGLMTQEAASSSLAGRARSTDGGNQAAIIAESSIQVIFVGPEHPVWQAIDDDDWSGAAFSNWASKIRGAIVALTPPAGLPVETVEKVWRALLASGASVQP